MPSLTSSPTLTNWGDLSAHESDIAAVSAAHQNLEDAWWGLLGARPANWHGPGSEAAELLRSELMARILLLQDEMNSLQVLMSLRNDVVSMIAGWPSE